MAIIRHTFRGSLQLTGALHIGSGSGSIPGNHDLQTDATIIRDSQGYPYLPGSSIRGVLRTAISQLAPRVFTNGQHFLIREEAELKEVHRQAQVKVNEMRQATHLVDTLDAEAVLQDQLDTLLTPAERLFGTVLWASPLIIPDLYPSTEPPYVSEVRHGVGIDRDTGAARDGAKYDFEVLPQQLTFAFFMRCDIPSSYRHMWHSMLALALRLLEQGELTLGGRAARGIGQVQLTALKVYTLSLDDRQALVRALLADDHDEKRWGTPQPAKWTQQILRSLQEVS